MSDEQFATIDSRLTTLITQHSQLMGQVDSIWVALVVFAFVEVALIACMLFAAAWSVRTVTNKQTLMEKQIADLEGKFLLLVDLLLEQAKQHRDIANG